MSAIVERPFTFHHLLSLKSVKARPFLFDTPIADVAAQMLKHGRAGVPMEVMGLMLGEFVDDYTVRLLSRLPSPSHRSVAAYTMKHKLIRKLCADIMCRRFRHASIGNNSHRRISGSRLPNQDVGYVEADWAVCFHAPYDKRIRRS